MSQHITVTRLFGSQPKIKNRKPPRTCLLCYREYQEDGFRTGHRDSIDPLDIENNQNAFTIFCKILDVDATVHSGSWDFANEALPFCTSCSALAFRLSSLYDELGVIQQEIILNTEMIKGSIQQSQDRSSRRVSADSRVDAFRHQVFQLMRRLSSNSGESYLQKYDEERDEMDHDHYEGQEEEAEEGIRERNLSLHHRDSAEDVHEGPYCRKNSDPREVPTPASPISPNYANSELYKEINPTRNEFKKEKKHLEYHNSSMKPMAEIKRKAVFVRNDIEVYEIEDSPPLVTNNNDPKCRNRNLDASSSTTEYGKLLESQLRIQRSYNQHFKHEAPCPLPLVKPHFSRPTFPSPPFDSPPNLQEAPVSYEKMVPTFVAERSPTYLSSSPPHESQRMTPPDSPMTPGMHNCHVCGKQYNKPYQLKAHLRLHTGEKPYRCSICAKTFRLAGNLRVHVRIHTGETPYECQFCGKRCTQKSQLNTHVLIHHKKSELLKRGIH